MPIPSRRQFLAQSVAATTATALSARSYAQVAGANKRLRVGIIGCGGMAEEHFNAYLASAEAQQVDVAAVCDVFDQRASQFVRRAKREDVSAWMTTDYRRILDSDSIDYVLIATPEHSHAYLAIDALDAGKHVYVEKPLAHSIEQGQAVAAKVRETGLQLQVGVQGMSDDSYSSAFEAIQAGQLGTLVQAQISYNRNYSADAGPFRKSFRARPKPAGLDWEAWLHPGPSRDWDAHRYTEWRCYRDYSGGIATDLLVHRVTRLIRACGLEYPSRVSGMGGIFLWDDGRDLPDHLDVLAQYPAKPGITNGMTVHLLGAMANDHQIEHCIRGDRATLVFTGDGWEIRGLDGEGVIERHTKTGAEDITLHHDNLHAAIRDGAALRCPVALGLYGLAVVDMANRSCAEGITYGWDAESASAVPA